MVATGWTLLPTNDVSLSDFNIESTVNPLTFQGAEDGTHYAAFRSRETDLSQDCLVQYFNTIPGQQYTVSFWVAITAASVSNTRLLPQWDWQGAGQKDMKNDFYFAPTNTGPVNYRKFTFTETASSNSTGLMFHGTDSNGAILLDNVVVTTANNSGVGVFRSDFFWVLDVDKNQQFNSPPDLAFPFGGIAGDIPITGDWNGDGRAKVGIYRASNGLFILDANGNGQFDDGDYVYNLNVGTPGGDVPVVGDWNGDGRTKVGLFRFGFFWILDFNGNGVFEQGIDKTYAFGSEAFDDVPVVGDWSGDGISKIGLFRQGFFWILDYNGNGTIDNVNQAGGDKAFAYGGISGDVPVVGDWNGDGRSKVGVFRSGFFWVLDANGNYQFDGTGMGHDLAFPFGGIAGDIPVVGKW